MVGRVFCLATQISLFAASPQTPWSALAHLPRHAPYTVLKRDGSCVTGSLLSVSKNWLYLGLDKHHSRSLLRSDIVRMSLGDTADVHATVYSGRSSWSDIQALHSPPADAELLVVTNDAREFSGRFLSASEQGLNVAVDGNELRFSKSYVSRVLLRSAEPVERSVGGRAKKVSLTKQPVLLYEGGAKEDDSRVDCSPAYRRQ